ncbi:hypothetical protein GLOTRDRAFT_97381, partial [Gloeophyllum trabeum ATCC 11539]
MLDTTQSLQSQNRAKVDKLKKVVMEQYSFLSRYEKCWPVHDMLKCHLKYTRTKKGSQKTRKGKGKAVETASNSQKSKLRSSRQRSIDAVNDKPRSRKCPPRYQTITHLLLRRTDTAVNGVLGQYDESNLGDDAVVNCEGNHGHILASQAQAKYLALFPLAVDTLSDLLDASQDGLGRRLTIAEVRDRESLVLHYATLSRFMQSSPLSAAGCCRSLNNSILKDLRCLANGVPRMSPLLHSSRQCIGGIVPTTPLLRPPFDSTSIKSVAEPPQGCYVIHTTSSDRMESDDRPTPPAGSVDLAMSSEAGLNLERMESDNRPVPPAGSSNPAQGPSASMGTVPEVENEDAMSEYEDAEADIEMTMEPSGKRRAAGGHDRQPPPRHKPEHGRTKVRIVESTHWEKRFRALEGDVAKIQEIGQNAISRLQAEKAALEGQLRDQALSNANMTQQLVTLQEMVQKHV